MTVGLTVEALLQARRVVDCAMACGDVVETPELHDFSRWAVGEERRLRQEENAPPWCPICGAVIAPSAAKRHDDWHAGLNCRTRW